MIGSNDLDEEETADLVGLPPTAGSPNRAARSAGTRPALGARRPARRRVARLLAPQLVFRGAWLDHRVKEGLLEVAWDEENGDFGYAEPRGGRALLELAPVPSWHELQFRR